MSYIGNSPVVQATRTVTELTATAGQTVFNANGGYTVGFLDVYLNGAQLQSADFTATNGTSVTLSSACTAGDAVRLEAWGTFSLASIPAVTPAAVSDQVNTSTGAFNPPKGTTAQRPVTPELGATRWNSTTNKLEVYTGGTSLWVNVASQATSYTVNYLVVAGGGGGGNAVSGTNSGGGGGAGGLLTGSFTTTSGTVYTATIGAGGSSNATNGNNSTLAGSGLTTVACIGGGAGGVGAGGSNGSAGGSGGGANGSSNSTNFYGGAGTAGQGNKGGDCALWGGASGGGAGEAGFSGSSGTYRGGNGLASSITGSSVYYAGGGAMNSGASSLGGGGAGVSGTGNGQANTGGGGGAYNSGSGSGGSGVVILSVPTTQYTGIVTGSPTVTTAGSNTVITFTSSGTYTA